MSMGVSRRIRFLPPDGTLTSTVRSASGEAAGCEVLGEPSAAGSTMVRGAIGDAAGCRMLGEPSAADSTMVRGARMVRGACDTLAK